MWLIDTKTKYMVRFLDNEIPRYAILSHTWGNEEISFEDFSTDEPKSLIVPSSKSSRANPGWAKIERACRKALDFDCRYVWVDTCCIDKSSSSELQEAINSTFRWYKDAYICFAYLEDVSSHQDTRATLSEFRRARWFTRGWTLQELLAPEDVVFFDRSWELLGSKHDFPQMIQEITGIGAIYVGWSSNERIPLSRASVAEKMSWAAERQTTRKEDMAYCLLGIFDIHMPMLYGEGIRAFTRLQEEIMKVNDDNSLLCWGYRENFDVWRLEDPAILAPNPTVFRNCSDIETRTLIGFTAPSFSMNQRGLSITLPVRPDQTHEYIIYGILGCGPKMSRNAQGNADVKSYLSIPLVSTRICEGEGSPRELVNNEYLRLNWCRVSLVSKGFLEQAETRDVVIRRTSEGIGQLRDLPFAFRIPTIPNEEYDVLGTYPPQPLALQFKSLCTFQPSQTKYWRKEFPLSKTSLKKLGLNKRDNWIEHAEMGQRIIHINLPSGALLIVLDYKAVIINCGIPKWDHKIECRVFRVPKKFSLELLHDLAATQDYSRLPELDRICERNESFFIITERPYPLELVLKIRRPPERFGITDVTAYVHDSSPGPSSNRGSKASAPGNSSRDIFNRLESRLKKPREQSRSRTRLSLFGLGPGYLFSEDEDRA